RAVGGQDRGRRAERFEAREHHHRIGLLDEMSAVMHADEEIEFLLPHAGANVGKALGEVHAGAVRQLGYMMLSSPRKRGPSIPEADVATAPHRSRARCLMGPRLRGHNGRESGLYTS